MKDLKINKNSLNNLRIFRNNLLFRIEIANKNLIVKIKGYIKFKMVKLEH